MKILDATLFITQFELKPPFLINANVLGMKRKAHYPVVYTQIKTYCEFWGSASLSIMHSLDQLQKGF